MDKIICLGKNYADHAAEMKDAPVEKPLLFIKPPSVLKEIKKGNSIDLPWERGAIHFETEVVFKLYKKNIIAVGVGLDLTLRDLQKELKEKGHPWERAKTFKNSCLISELKSTKDFPLGWEKTPFSLLVNGEKRQEALFNQAIMRADEIIHYANENFPLCDGDLIFTGTPAGVGPLKSGDQLTLKFGPIDLSFGVI